MDTSKGSVYRLRGWLDMGGEHENIEKVITEKKE